VSLKKADKNGGCQILPLNLKGRSVNSSYCFIDVQFIFWLFHYKTVFGALKTLVEFGVQLGAPSCRSRYAVCQVTLWRKFRIRFLTLQRVNNIISTCSDLLLLPGYGTLKFESIRTGGHENTRNLVQYMVIFTSD
jgi:hypothetical protein